MSKKGKKEYEKVEGEEWIEMQDLNKPSNQNMSKKFAQIQGREFCPPKSQIKYEYEQPTSMLNANQFSQHNRQPFAKSYNVPTQSVPKKKKITPSLPMMQMYGNCRQATCDFCTVVQLVPGNCQVFICGACQNMNECFPLYGVVVCGNCQHKVGFGFGMSNFVKCPKCSSINKVPIQPTKNYQSFGEMLTKPVHPPPSRPQQQKTQQREEKYPVLPEQEYEILKDKDKQFWQERQVQRGSRMGGFEPQQLEYIGMEAQKKEEFND